MLNRSAFANRVIRGRWAIPSATALILLIASPASPSRAQSAADPPTPGAAQPPGLDLSPPSNATAPAEATKQDSRVVARKLALPPATITRLGELRPLEELAETLESGALENIPADTDPADLVRYLKELSSLSEVLAEDYRSIQTSITQAQGNAAEQALDHAADLPDQDFYLAARLGLSAKINQVPFSSDEQQRQVCQLVERQLSIGVEQGLQMTEVRNVVRLTEYLEQYADRNLALQASTTFADILRRAETVRFQDTIAKLDDTRRRLNIIGQPFDLSGTTVTGEPLKWSDYRGKVVLVNFWAAWSVTCIAELPQLKQLYETYQPQGFEIIGVSLDENRRELEVAITNERLPWTNLFHEGTGTQHPMAVKYGVRTIPTAFLIDAEGKVVSTQARGDELEQWLYRLFGPESFIARDLVIQSSWKEAIDELQKLVTKHPRNIDYRIALGAVQLLADDPQGYAETCQASWISLMRESPQPQLMPLFCLPGNHPLDRQPLFALARALRARQDSAAAKLALIMAAYRANQDAVCLAETIDQADAFTMAAAKLTQAMAAHRAGKNDQAAEWMNEGRRIVTVNLFDLAGPRAPDLPYEHWICCIVTRLLLNEAELAIARQTELPSEP